MKTRCFLSGVALLFFLFATNSRLSAKQQPDFSANQMPSVVTVPPEAQPSDHFDAEAATNAYLAQIPANARARSDAYFDGGYWLILWDFLVSMVIYWLLLRFGRSAHMRNLVERLTRFRPLQTFLYWLQFLILTTLLGFPLTVYEGYFREHKYRLATQTFGPWLQDQLKALLLGIILGGVVAMILFGIVRRLPNTWHIWGAVASTLFLIIFVLIVPIYLRPVFNKSTRLEDPGITQPILIWRAPTEFPPMMSSRSMLRSRPRV